MPAKDTFQKVAQRQLEGVMFHDALASYLAAIGCADLGRHQAKQAQSEFVSLLLTKSTYAARHDAVLQDAPTNYRPSIIPGEWYGAMPTLTDAQRQNALATGLQSWLEWEQGTRKFLTGLADDASLSEEDSQYVQSLITGVRKELASIHTLMAKYGV